MSRRLAIGLAVALALLAGAVCAHAVVTQKGNLRLTVTGDLSPNALPRSGTAPIAASVAWEIASADGSPVPKLNRLRVEINRQGRFDYRGLPTCPYARIHPASSARALANCRAALVGKGSFTAIVALEGQEEYPARGRLLIFNGKRAGKPVLLGQIYAPHPFPTSFVITFAVRNLTHGTYGTALDAVVPKELSAWGNLTGVSMTLSRKFRFRGHRHSYLRAGCPAPKGFSTALFSLARTSFVFSGGMKLGSVSPSTCRAKP